MKKICNKNGQGMLEYILISTLIGIFCLGAVKIFGKTLKQRIHQMEKKIKSDARIY